MYNYLKRHILGAVIGYMESDVADNAGTGEGLSGADNANLNVTGNALVEDRSGVPGPGVEKSAGSKGGNSELLSIVEDLHVEAMALEITVDRNGDHNIITGLRSSGAGAEGGFALCKRGNGYEAKNHEQRNEKRKKLLHLEYSFLILCGREIFLFAQRKISQ